MAPMDKRARNAWVWLAGCWVALAWPAAMAVAAATKTKKGGAPPLDKSLSFWALLVTIVTLLGICVVAFKNSRRMHGH